MNALEQKIKEGLSFEIHFDKNGLKGCNINVEKSVENIKNVTYDFHQWSVKTMYSYNPTTKIFVYNDEPISFDELFNLFIEETYK